MNEQIRDLAEHCDFYVGNEHSEKSHEEKQRIWVEKFAELIIEECVDYAFANGDNVDYLKQYFGVEE